MSGYIQFDADCGIYFGFNSPAPVHPRGNAEDVYFNVETISAWGQRAEPSPQTLIGFSSGVWGPVGDGSRGGKYERLGVYLGRGLVLLAGIFKPTDAV